MIRRTLIALSAAGLLAVAANANAGTIDSSSFDAVTSAGVFTTGALDWGYVNSVGGDSGLFDSNRGGAGSLNNTPFGAVTRDEGAIITAVSGASQIGLVTLTEGAGTDVIAAQSNASPYFFDFNATAGAYGGFAPTEQDIWTITFNDLGVGTFTITLYLGHTNTGRSFDMDVVLSDSGGNDSTTTNFGPLSSLGSTVGFAGGDAFTYTATVTTTAADADLSLTHGGTGGSFGGALFAGYTVFGTGIPEPASLALLGLGGLLIARRR